MSTTSEEKRSLPREAQRAFLQVVMSAEHELQRASQRLRDSLGGQGQGNASAADARSLAQLFVDRARQQRDELEHRIEREVQAALLKVRAPIDRELDAMRGRLERVGQKLDALRPRRRS